LKTLWRSLVAALILTTGARAFDQVFIDASVNDSLHVVTGTVRVTFDSLSPTLPDIRFRLFANVLCERVGMEVSDSAGLSSIRCLSTVRT
jgi:hypothetical protein